ncbi:MAG: phage holin family protein [Deltaproteobacteria bacterium]|nr:phage holin family protein [Deltaproteobacteria bacterium]
MGFFAHWVVTAVALLVAQKLVGGIYVAGFGALAVAALVLGLVNAIIKPVMQLLSLPLTILTLGIFYLVVNGICFALAAFLVPGFAVASLGSAVLGAIVVSLISWVLGGFLSRDNRKEERR